MTPTFSLLSRSFCRALLRLVLAGAAFAAGAAQAEPLVVASVDPYTLRVTVFEDLLVKKFSDGSAITRLYGKHNAISNGFQLLRAGKLANGACRTEVFALVRLSGNRLAIAAPGNPSIAWNRLIPQKMFATFDCTSYDCFSCDSSNAADPMGTQPETQCACRDGNGSCNTVAPGTGGPYGPGALVILNG